MASKKTTRSGAPKRSKLYVGVNVKKGIREVFRAKQEPTEKSHGKLYGYVIGPFNTKRGAEIMAKDFHSPLVQTVSDAEYYARQEKKTTKRRLDKRQCKRRVR